MQSLSNEKLSKVIPNIKNAGTDKGALRVCDDWWTDLSNKTVGF